MQRLLASLTIVLLLGMVITRVLLMRRSGIRAMHFGKIDKKDFLIQPFAFFYIYIVFAAAFGLPMVSKQQFFDSEALAWVGVFLCGVGLLLFLLSLISFGRSFRVGIDVDQPDRLITTGVFALSRNPIYIAFWIIMLGQFLVFPNWLLLVYLGAATGAGAAPRCRRVHRGPRRRRPKPGADGGAGPSQRLPLRAAVQGGDRPAAAPVPHRAPRRAGQAAPATGR
jgi:protein-S-isoprenylcysteine O-methyltransferase Ste14